MSNSQKMSARERINCLLDANSFVEIGANVSKRNTDFNLTQKEAPSDGVITGYGLIDSTPVYVYSQDVSVLNGTVGEMHAKKIVNVYDNAMKIGVPVIGLIDCGGLRLQEATDALDGFGKIYTKQIEASGVIPQVSAVFGTCGGASAISAAMTDFTFMTKESARIFVNAPNTVDGVYAGRCDISDSDNVARVGNADFVCEDEETLLAELRTLIGVLPSNNIGNATDEECTDDLNRLTPEIYVGVKDSAYMLSVLSDNNLFIETKKNYAKEMVTGFIKLNGVTIGAVANRGEILDEEGKVSEKLDNSLTASGCQKAERFVNFCDAFNIPILTLTDVKGFATTRCNEAKLAVSVARLTKAFCEASVAKINVITGDALSSAYISMNSKHIGADMVFTFDGIKIGPMEPKMAAQIMYADEIAGANDKQSMINEKAELIGYGLASSESAAKRGYVDSIIDPQTTRKNLIYAFEMFLAKEENYVYKKHGTI